MSTATLREVRLYGPLGARFGRVFHLAVQSPSEAGRALCAVVPGFREAFLGPDGLARYFVFVGRGAGRHTIAEHERHDLVGRGEPIRFVPVIEGAKKGGALQTIVGATLFIVGVAMGVAGALTGNPLLYQAGIAIGNAGVALFLGGVVQMLSPQRKPEDKKATDPSYGMDGGAINNVDTGTPVPIAYGRMIVGSTQISGGLTTDEIVAVGSGGSLPPQTLPNYMAPYVVDSGAIMIRETERV